MRSLYKMLVLGAFFVLGGQAGAQNIGTGAGYVKTKPILAWAAKTATPAPYVAPNKPIWRIADIMAAHKGQTDWVQPTVLTRDFVGDYISMGPGKKTKSVFYADDPVLVIVQSGQIRFTIDTQEPFVATKGFRVTIPYRLAYSMETVGDEPSVRWELRPAGEAPNYPITETPTPIKGIKYIKATYVGHGSFPKDKPPYVDFFKIISDGSMPGQRGPQVPTPPASNYGHFHSNWGEFWFIAEGTLDFQIEGEPLIHAHQGDVVSAAYERWHRPTNSGPGMSTRLAFIPRTNNLHWYQPTGEAGEIKVAHVAQAEGRGAGEVEKAGSVIPPRGWWS